MQDVVSVFWKENKCYEYNKNGYVTIERTTREAVTPKNLHSGEQHKNCGEFRSN